MLKWVRRMLAKNAQISYSFCHQKEFQFWYNFFSVSRRRKWFPCPFLRASALNVLELLEVFFQGLQKGLKFLQILASLMIFSFEIVQPMRDWSSQLSITSALSYLSFSLTHKHTLTHLCTYINSLSCRACLDPNLL